MENFDHILLFKTNCCTVADRSALYALMAGQTGVEEWNLDLDDCDYVLRVITHTLDQQCITDLLQLHGYECCELI